jgi:ABC-type glycerol-3-phosphate transport system permease component
VFLTYLVPDTLLFIPLFKIVGGLGLLNSIAGGAGAGLSDADGARSAPGS